MSQNIKSQDAIKLNQALLYRVYDLILSWPEPETAVHREGHKNITENGEATEKITDENSVKTMSTFQNSMQTFSKL